MKKGCFVSTISLLTILVAVFIYLIKNQPQVFEDMFRPFIVDISSKDMMKNIDEKVKESKYKDSVKTLVKLYSNKMIKEKKAGIDQTGDFVDIIQSVIRDGIIDSAEINEIHKYILENENERPKKN